MRGARYIECSLYGVSSIWSVLYMECPLYGVPTIEVPIIEVTNLEVAAI